jgi:transcriptional regulator with XRE-family HTH domain
MLKIRECRERAGMSQEQLAKSVGITQVYLCYLEKGKKKNPSITLLNKIAIALNVNINELLDSA